MATRKALKHKEPKVQRITDNDVNAAMQVIKQDYYQDVRDLVDDLVRQVREGEITSEDQLSDMIHQDVEGSARVIYTFQNKLGLLASDNEDAYEDEMGEVPTDGTSINWAAKMVMAMIKDVEEAMPSIDFDVEPPEIDD